MRVAGLAIALFITAGVAAADAAARRPAALQLSHMGFAQQDWHATDRRHVVRDTQWGVFRYRYRRVKDRTRFLNLVVVANRRGSWAIGNMPIYPAASRGGLIKGTTFINLGELGVEQGTPLRAVCFTARLSHSRLRSVPRRIRRCRRVRSERYLAGDHPSVTPPGSFRSGVGAPRPIRYSATEPVPKLLRMTSAAGARVQAAQEPIGPDRVDYNRVNEGARMCMPGAIARSLDWLNRQYNFGVDQTAQEFYEGLKSAGVGKAPDQQGISTQPDAVELGRGRRLAAKMRYVDRTFGAGRIETKVWDAESGAANDGAIRTNLPKSSPNAEDPTDFDEWLQREWQAGEDVEIGWISPQSSHIVTLTEVAVDADGRFKIKYREDRTQGSRHMGDEGPLDGTMFKAPVRRRDAPPVMKWRFGDASREGANLHIIQYAISESPTAEFRPDRPGVDPPPGNQTDPPPETQPPPNPDPPPEVDPPGSALTTIAPWWATA